MHAAGIGLAPETWTSGPELNDAAVAPCGAASARAVRNAAASTARGLRPKDLTSLRVNQMRYRTVLRPLPVSTAQSALWRVASQAATDSAQFAPKTDKNSVFVPGELRAPAYRLDSAASRHEEEV